MELDDILKSPKGEFSVPNEDQSLDVFEVTALEPRIVIHGGPLPKGKYICIHGEEIHIN